MNSVSSYSELSAQTLGWLRLTDTLHVDDLLNRDLVTASGDDDATAAKFGGRGAEG